MDRRNSKNSNSNGVAFGNFCCNEAVVSFVVIIRSAFRRTVFLKSCSWVVWSFCSKFVWMMLVSFRNAMSFWLQLISSIGVRRSNCSDLIWTCSKTVDKRISINYHNSVILCKSTYCLNLKWRVAALWAHPNEFEPCIRDENCCHYLDCSGFESAEWKDLKEFRLARFFRFWL